MALTGVRERRMQGNYLDCGVSGTAAYEFLGTGFKELNEEPGAKTSGKRYINSKSTSKAITGYEWQSPFSADQIRSERAIEYICAVGELQKTGGEAEADYVIVDLDKREGETGTVYKARKIRVAIEVSKFGDEDGEMTCEGNFLGIGDMVIGTFDTSAKTFTAAGVVTP